MVFQFGKFSDTLFHPAYESVPVYCLLGFSFEWLHRVRLDVQERV